LDDEVSAARSLPAAVRSSDLVKLAGLREKGITSEAEFQQGKAKILS
jgi:hypothetical protein